MFRIRWRASCGIATGPAAVSRRRLLLVFFPVVILYIVVGFVGRFRPGGSVRPPRSFHAASFFRHAGGLLPIGCRRSSAAPSSTPPRLPPNFLWFVVWGWAGGLEVCGRALVSPYFTYPPPLSSIPPIPLPLSYSFNPVDACCVGVS